MFLVPPDYHGRPLCSLGAAKEAAVIGGWKWVSCSGSKTKVSKNCLEINKSIQKLVSRLCLFLLTHSH